MNYPLISEYVEAIKAAEDNFDQLKLLRPVWGEDGEPVMTSGNFAVVFKMKDEQTGKLHAVKCFLKEQEGRAEAYRQIAEELEYVSSTFLTPIKYLDKELFVDSANSEDSEFPVLLMDWVEGQTLDKYIREHIDDQYELSLLAYQFSRLAMWLMPQPFAHGDLKPDNILVKEDGTLVLVDYDGMYVPAMKGQKARELGSPDFRHPGRTEEVFDDHIDDFSLASILLSLKAIALQPSLLEEYGASDRLLFSETDYRNLSESKVMDALKPLMQDAELASLYSLYILALSQNNLSQVSFRLFNLSRPDRSQYEDENLSTGVTEEDLANAWTDRYGAKYSRDWSILLKGPDSDVVKSMVINSNNFPEGDFWLSKPILSKYTGNTIYWCSNDSFHDGIFLYLDRSIWRNLDDVNKHSVWNRITNGYYMIKEAHDIDTDEWLMDKNKQPIMMVAKMTEKTHGDWSGGSTTYFEELKETTIYSIKEGTCIISDYAFSNCKSLKQVVLPDSIQIIGRNVFKGCDSLQAIKISSESKEKFERLLPQYKDIFLFQYIDSIDDLPF